MPDLLETASNWLQSQRKLHRTKSVVYRRGVHSVTLSGTVGRTVFEQTYSDGVITRFQSRDYLITAADLVLNGETVLPEAGDHIEETVGDTTYRYEVLPPGGEPAWRYSDPYRQTLRVHTKEVGG